MAKLVLISRAPGRMEKWRIMKKYSWVVRVIEGRTSVHT